MYSLSSRIILTCLVLNLEIVFAFVLSGKRRRSFDGVQPRNSVSTQYSFVHPETSIKSSSKERNYKSEGIKLKGLSQISPVTTEASYRTKQRNKKKLDSNKSRNKKHTINQVNVIFWNKARNFIPFKSSKGSNSIKDNEKKIYQCSFPFIYDGKTRYSCLKTENNEKKWCSLTSNYDRDMRWIFCPKNVISKSEGQIRKIVSKEYGIRIKTNRKHNNIIDFLKKYVKTNPFQIDNANKLRNTTDITRYVDSSIELNGDYDTSPSENEKVRLKEMTHCFVKDHKSYFWQKEDIQHDEENNSAKSVENKIDLATLKQIKYNGRKNREKIQVLNKLVNANDFELDQHGNHDRKLDMNEKLVIKYIGNEIGDNSNNSRSNRDLYVISNALDGTFQDLSARNESNDIFKMTVVPRGRVYALLDSALKKKKTNEQIVKEEMKTVNIMLLGSYNENHFNYTSRAQKVTSRKTKYNIMKKRKTMRESLLNRNISIAIVDGPVLLNKNASDSYMKTHLGGVIKNEGPFRKEFTSQLVSEIYSKDFTLPIIYNDDRNNLEWNTKKQLATVIAIVRNGQ